MPSRCLQDSPFWYLDLPWQKLLAEAGTLAFALAQPVLATGLTVGQIPNGGNDAFERWFQIQAPSPGSESKPPFARVPFRLKPSHLGHNLRSRL